MDCVRKPPLSRCQRCRVSFAMVTVLLFLALCTAASKGFPRNAGGAGSSSSHNRSKGVATQNASAAAAALAGTRGQEQPRRRNPQSMAAAAAAAEELDDDDDDRGSGSGSDSGSGFYSDESDDVWSEDIGSDDDGWGDQEEDEDVWGKGAAGGPGRRGASGGEAWRRRRRRGAGKESGSGRGAGGGAGEGNGVMGSMSNVRSRLNKARQRASSVYREAKSLMSSEMEGVVLKATRPDDLPVKPKHLESLMRPTTEMPKEFNVYLPVVRKLWSKMADKEWRVAAKALYVVHRFATDGSMEHASNLKESVAVLRTHHDSRRKVNYFDMDTICDVRAPSWSGEDVAPMAGFLRGYANFVLQRATHFDPAFGELMDAFSMLGELLTPVEELVSAGLGCFDLDKDQESAITVAATLQVARDVRNVVEVSAAQLYYLSRELQARSTYPAEVGRWYAWLCETREPVEAMIDRANELVERHKLTFDLPPLTAAPLVLRLWDEEMAIEKQAAQDVERRQQQEQEQQCSTDEEDERIFMRHPDAEQAGTVGLGGAGERAAAWHDNSSSGDGSSEIRDQATITTADAHGSDLDEKASPSTPALATASEAKAVAPAAAARSRKSGVTNNRARVGREAENSSSPSPRKVGVGGAAVPTSTKRVSGGGGGGGGGAKRQKVGQNPPPRGAVRKSGSPQRDDDVAQARSKGAERSVKGALDGAADAGTGGVNIQAPKKKRTASTVGSKVRDTEERRPKPSSSVKRNVKHGAGASARSKAGATSAADATASPSRGSSNSSSSSRNSGGVSSRVSSSGGSSRPEQQQPRQPKQRDPSAPIKKRKKRRSLPAEEASPSG